MKPIFRLLITQFLSALADNMVLMVTISIVLANHLGHVYVGVVQASFFVAYVLLAPYAGILSEKIPKSSVLWIGNALKLLGSFLLICHVSPAFSYAIIGIGACVYGPGKYAILRELTHTPQDLYRANGWVEGSTIVAILIGTVAGGMLASVSFSVAMGIVIACYSISFLFAWVLPRGSVSSVSFRHTWRHFASDIATLCRIPAARTSMIGTSNFWMLSAVLRLAAIAWIPVALHVTTDKASLYMGVSAIGIMFGAFFSPRFISLQRLSRLWLIGLGMSITVMVVGWLPHPIMTAILLFIAGFFGGSFMVPLNTTLQESGDTVGPGKIIAIQNFFENLLMLTGTLLYTAALHVDISIPVILLISGGWFGIISLYISRLYHRIQSS